jgi:hypothetical protein
VAGTPCTTLSVLPATSGSSIPATVTRTTTSQSSVPTGIGGVTSLSSTESTSSSTSSHGSPTPSTNSGIGFVKVSHSLLLWAALLVLLIQ